MKEKTSPTRRKLTLHRETLQLLEEPELAAVHGAGPSQGATGPCLTCPNCVATLDGC